MAYPRRYPGRCHVPIEQLTEFCGECQVDMCPSCYDSSHREDHTEQGLRETARVRTENDIPWSCHVKKVQLRWYCSRCGYDTCAWCYRNFHYHMDPAPVPKPVRSPEQSQQPGSTGTSSNQGDSNGHDSGKDLGEASGGNGPRYVTSRGQASSESLGEMSFGQRRPGDSSPTFSSSQLREETLQGSSQSRDIVAESFEGDVFMPSSEGNNFSPSDSCRQSLLPSGESSKSSYYDITGSPPHHFGSHLPIPGHKLSSALTSQHVIDTESEPSAAGKLAEANKDDFVTTEFFRSTRSSSEMSADVSLFNRRGSLADVQTCSKKQQRHGERFLVVDFNVERRFDDVSLLMHVGGDSQCVPRHCCEQTGPANCFWPLYEILSLNAKRRRHRSKRRSSSATSGSGSSPNQPTAVGKASKFSQKRGDNRVMRGGNRVTRGANCAWKGENGVRKRYDNFRNGQNRNRKSGLSNQRGKRATRRGRSRNGQSHVRREKENFGEEEFRGRYEMQRLLRNSANKPIFDRVSLHENRMFHKFTTPRITVVKDEESPTKRNSGLTSLTMLNFSDGKNTRPQLQDFAFIRKQRLWVFYTVGKFLNAVLFGRSGEKLSQIRSRSMSELQCFGAPPGIDQDCVLLQGKVDGRVAFCWLYPDRTECASALEDVQSSMCSGGVRHIVWSSATEKHYVSFYDSRKPSDYWRVSMLDMDPKTWVKERLDFKLDIEGAVLLDVSWGEAYFAYALDGKVVLCHRDDNNNYVLQKNVFTSQDAPVISARFCRIRGSDHLLVICEEDYWIAVFDLQSFTEVGQLNYEYGMRTSPSSRFPWPRIVHVTDSGSRVWIGCANFPSLIIVDLNLEGAVKEELMY